MSASCLVIEVAVFFLENFVTRVFYFLFMFVGRFIANNFQRKSIIQVWLSIFPSLCKSPKTSIISSAESQ